MKNFKCLFYFLAIASMNHVTVCADIATNWTYINEICGVSYSVRIIGGINAKLGEYPWIALIGIRRLQDDNVNFKIVYDCGGSLIHPLYVLTAAHCATGFQTGEGIVDVKLGEHDIETEIDCADVDHCADPVQVIKAKSVFVPTEYDTENLKHDIALIELSKAAKITDYVIPVCLPWSDELRQTNLVDKKVVVAGWGVYEIDDFNKSRILQKVSLPVLSNDECKKQSYFENLNIDYGQICVGGIEGKDSCNGDSGGPLVKVIQDMSFFKAPKFIQFGLVSQGVPSCGKFPMPAIYTNISHYFPWILKNIKI